MLKRANPPAMPALPARFPGSAFAVDRAREFNGQRFGANARRSAEQVPVGQAVLRYGIHEPLPLSVVAYNAIECHMEGSVRRDGPRNGLCWISPTLLRN